MTLPTLTWPVAIVISCAILAIGVVGWRHPIVPLAFAVVGLFWVLK